MAYDPREKFCDGQPGEIVLVGVALGRLPATASTGYAPERRSKLVAELSDVVVPACF